MIRRWIRAHASLVATATSGFLVAVLVATVAIVSSGYTAQRLDLGDGAVWVSNGTDRFIGRANTDVLELNTVVASDGADIDVVQRDTSVLLLDRTSATVGIVDAATSVVTDKVPLPPAQPGVFIAGSNVVVYSRGTGQVWITPLADLADFDAEKEATLSLGAGSVVSVDENGLLFAFSPEAKKVYRVDAAASTTVQSTQATKLGGTTGDYEVTSVGGRWAVLDTVERKLELDGRVVDLTAAIAAGSTPVLPVASATASTLLVGYSRGVLAVDPSSGAITPLYQDASGAAAAPVTVAGCSFAAWSDGQSWRRCGDKKATLTALDSMPSSAKLEFQVNRATVVLNDAQAGASWAVQDSGGLINNWSDLIKVNEDQQQVEQNDETIAPEVEKDQLPPVAVDDEFGARAARASVLPVLLNDYDPNSDVLVISSVTPIDAAVGRIDLIDNHQQLQLTLEAAAHGTISFEYTIDDGRGGTATAGVVVTVRAPGENSPPRQMRTTRTTVESGGQVTVPVLGDWVDPDGDPFYLASATVQEPMAVSFKPEGTVIVTDPGQGTSLNSVALVVSDGTAEGTGGLSVTTRAVGDVPLIADPFVILAYAGQEITISPLEHVRGGSGIVRLNAVPAKTGITVTPSYETGTFRFLTSQVRAHYIEYVVTDNDQTVTGLVRIDVASPPDANTKPIVHPHTVFVPTLGTKTLDIAATDDDPAGGVLLVTGVMNVPGASGVRAEVLDQRSVRVTLTGPLAGDVSFNYRISNGLAEAEGTIRVVEVAKPTRLQPPIARDDTATVRVGDAITIDVMKNDEQPDGEPISLNPVLVDGLTGNSGLLFASGNSLRYLAPATTGNFTAVYEIVGPLGQTAQAQLTIEVREPSVETNHPPVPTTVVARVLAGESVRIEIPLDGIDPDGDSVQLLGQESSPQKGSVVDAAADYIDYEAGTYSAGTDSFTYTVMDALGARATGTVRIGISPPLDGARNPVAIEDEITARPGTTVSVQVLANDSDPDGSPLTVVSALPNDKSLTATILRKQIVQITVPKAEGVYGLVYSIANELGGTSSNFVTVIARSDAPLAYPVASDTVLTLTDVLDRTTINVDVLRNVFFADGNARDLDLSIVPGYAGTAEVTANKQIRVTIGNSRQIIPFAVTRPDDKGVRSYAFIWVPGFKDALPQLNRDAPKLQVDSEDTLTIDLDDYVLAVGGKRVRLTDSSTVRATHADGSSLVVDAHTLRFRSADLYFGAASISFEVTDGSSATDPAGRKANLVLPITVNPRENQPPVFTGATIDFEPGQSKVIDLTHLTNYPYVDDVDELAYTVGTPAPVGFTWDLAGQSLTIRANDDAAKGIVTALSLGVRDSQTAGQAGRIQLQVVPSTRPLAVPALDTAITKRGETTTIDVLANDEATNPFPGRPLRVVAVRGIDGVPAGVAVAASADNSRLSVTVAQNAAPFDISLQYQVSDATRDPSRYVWGSVRVSVQDVPDAPAKPVRAAGFVEGELRLRLTAPEQNNSPIVNYRVTAAGGYTHDCGTTLICALPGLTVGTPYTFQVIATNGVGDSLPSAASDPLTLDYLPAAPVLSAVATAPADAPAGGSITLSWPKVADPAPGTAVVGYTVEVAGRDPVSVGRDVTKVTIPGLPTATTFTAVVYARNSAQVTSAADWRRSGSVAATTIGPPTVGNPAPVAANGPDGTLVVSWGAFGANGGSTPTYDIRRVAGTASASDCSAAPTTTGVSSPWTDTNAVDGESYSYLVYARNGSGWYCTAVSTGAVVTKAPPGKAYATADVVDSGTGQLDIRANPDFAASGIPQRYEYRLNGGAWASVVPGQWLTSLANSAVYGVPQSVTFRACRDETANYCGEPSDASIRTPINARAGIVSCVLGQVPLASPPVNLGTVVTEYAFAYNLELVPGIPIWTGFTYSESDPVPSEAVGVRVRATAIDGALRFTDPGYGGDLVCS